MVTTERNLMEGSIPYAIKEDRITLSKMYPDTDLDDKYVLFLAFDLCWQYLYQEITAEINITTHGNGSITPKIKARKIYPNKDYFTCCMKKGNKLCDTGVPLIFDNYEELAKISRLECRWKISTDEMDVYFQIHYDVGFEKEDGKRVYVIRSREVDISYLFSEKAKGGIFKSTEKLEEYDKVILIVNNLTNKSFSCKTIIDKVETQKEHAIDSISVIFDNISLKDYINDTDRMFHINYFYADETLRPADAISMIG